MLAVVGAWISAKLFSFFSRFGLYLVAAISVVASRGRVARLVDELDEGLGGQVLVEALVEERDGRGVECVREVKHGFGLVEQVAVDGTSSRRRYWRRPGSGS